jgi:hypothetical protein
MRTNIDLLALPLDERIDRLRSDIRTDKLDITFGELANMYESGELVINPAYQRLFRWKRVQRTRFIESLLLGIPTPAIFVAETQDGVWELVDGLQRVSTVFEFMGVLKDPDGTPVRASRLREIEGATIPGLGGKSYKRFVRRNATVRIDVADYL